MKIAWATILFAAVSVGGAPPAPPPPDGLVVSPAHGWVLPLFTSEGYRSMTLRGDRAEVHRNDRIDVEDVKIDLFAGNATNQVTTTILSPEASYFPRENQARGPSTVRVLRYSDNAELTGEDWSYDFRTGAGGVREKLILRRHVRVVLQQTLHDFLQ